MKKFNTVKILTIFILVILTSGCRSSEKSFLLRGTFTCTELPFVSMVFDPDNHYTFYYYYHDYKEGKGKLDKGSYLKTTDSNYIIKSSIFNNIEITYKKAGFNIIINDKTYYFKQIDAIPSIQTNYESRKIDNEKNIKFNSLFLHPYFINRN